MPWVEISQAAFTMGISERTIRNWVKSGKINAKTENGKRMVEIPDEELNAGGPESEAFTDGSAFDGDGDGDHENMLDTQKRLEVALLECGRVKGTLASQERIMETLSSNIAELTAKLQKAQNKSWKLLLLCVVIAALGALTVLIRHQYDQASFNKDKTELKNMVQQMRDEVKDAQITVATTERRVYEEKDKLRDEFEKREAERLEKARQDMKEQQAQVLAKLEENYKDQIEDKRITITDLREKLDAEQDKVTKLEENEKLLKEEVEKLKSLASEQARQIEKLEEYKAQVAKLQADLIEERNRNLQNR